MYSRHLEVPSLHRRQGSVAASDFNRVCRALKRHGPEIRLSIPGLKTMDIIIQPQAWVVVDRAFNDLPIVAWTEFEDADRDALHRPIGCRLVFFHGHASMIQKRVFEAMESLLDQLLDSDQAPTFRVLDFPGQDES